MGKKRTYSTLDGYQEVFKEEPGRSTTFLKITRHMPKKGKTYLCYWFYNPRPAGTRDNREPDKYEYKFRIFWKSTGPVLYKYVVYHGHHKDVKTEWQECDPRDDFNMFPNYTGMIQQIQSIIAEHYLLIDHTESRENHETRSI